MELLYDPMSSAALDTVHPAITLQGWDFRVQQQHFLCDGRTPRSITDELCNENAGARLGGGREAPLRSSAVGRLLNVLGTQQISKVGQEAVSFVVERMVETVSQLVARQQLETEFEQAERDQDVLFTACAQRTKTSTGKQGCTWLCTSQSNHVNCSSLHDRLATISAAREPSGTASVSSSRLLPTTYYTTDQSPDWQIPHRTLSAPSANQLIDVQVSATSTSGHSSLNTVHKAAPAGGSAMPSKTSFLPRISKTAMAAVAGGDLCQSKQQQLGTACCRSKQLQPTGPSRHRQPHKQASAPSIGTSIVISFNCTSARSAETTDHSTQFKRTTSCRPLTPPTAGDRRQGNTRPCTEMTLGAPPLIACNVKAYWLTTPPALLPACLQARLSELLRQQLDSIRSEVARPGTSKASLWK